MILNYDKPDIVSAEVFNAPWIDLVVRWLKERDREFTDWFVANFRDIVENPDEFFGEEPDNAMLNTGQHGSDVQYTDKGKKALLDRLIRTVRFPGTLPAHWSQEISRGPFHLYVELAAPGIIKIKVRENSRPVTFSGGVDIIDDQGRPSRDFLYHTILLRQGYQKDWMMDL